MKKNLTIAFLLLLFTSSFLFSQPTTHPFELGLNGGASWLSSDIRMKKLGGGFGLTFGQMYGMNKKNLLMAGWRLRYLDANTYGQDSRRSYGLSNNAVLNGTFDPSLNYAANPGYVYQNYKTHIDEFSLEGVVSFNQGLYFVYPYVFGGVGLVRAVAHTNQLDPDGNPYDYTAINSSGNDGRLSTLNQISGISDNSYETLADGNRSPSWKFMPSLGVGIGFELAPVVSLGLEYKATWALNDVLDGQRWTNNNTPTAHNDMYHYANIWLKFDFGRGHTHTTTTTTSEPITYTPPPPAMPLPVISISNPPSPGLSTDRSLLVLTGKIYNINNVNDMHIAVNGVPASGYFYNPETQDFSFAVQLAPGMNTFDIGAANSSGTVNASTSLILQPMVVMPPPPDMMPVPVVEIREPHQDPFFTNDGVISVRGTAMYINSIHELQVTVNGFDERNVSFNPATHAFVVTSHLAPGANTFVITASNPAGSDTKATTVITQQGQVPNSAPKPQITMVSPNMNPYSTTSDMISISASVQFINSRNAITVITNGAPNNSFIYDPRSGNTSFAMHLVPGNNTLQIQAVNAMGSDVKNQTIVYAPPVSASDKPQITITVPGLNPFTTTAASTAITATVDHVTALSQISVTLNGAAIASSHLSFATATHQLTFSASLVNGNNTIVISAANAAGSDSKTQTIVRTNNPITMPRPIVTFTNPAVNPFNTMINSEIIRAKVTNITSVSQVTATVNESVVSAGLLNYSAPSQEVSFNANFVNGSNTIVVSAVNAGGSDSKTATIVYAQPVATPKPEVTIITPSANPYNSPNSSTNVEASVTNVTSLAQIVVTLNGAPVAASELSFNATSHTLNFTAHLVGGMNTVTIAASNASGSDSKSLSIKLASPGVVLSKPMITFTSPASNPYNTSASSYTVTATIVGVAGASGINVTLNGRSVSAGNWSYNSASQQFSYAVNLASGTNNIQVTAFNDAGSISGTQVIIRSSGPVTTTPRPAVITPHTTTSPSAPTPAPSTPAPSTTMPAPAHATPAPMHATTPMAVGEPQFTLLTPSSTSVTTTDATCTIEVMVSNVSNAADISILVNGTGYRGSSFDTRSGKLSIPLTLVNGTNTVMIEAKNSSGSKTQKITVIKN